MKVNKTECNKFSNVDQKTYPNCTMDYQYRTIHVNNQKQILTDLIRPRPNASGGGGTAPLPPSAPALCVLLLAMVTLFAGGLVNQ